MTEIILLRHRQIPNLNQLDVYRQHGGFDAFKKAVTSMNPYDVTDQVKNSGLRGRGGAGFPTGLKWTFIDYENFPHYVVANADESEPGTFKDREILEGNPFQFLEGVALAAFAIEAHHAYIYLRGEFWQITETLDRQIADLEAAGLLGDNLFGTDYSLRIYTHLGAGAYICGEETALIESLEGKRGEPRKKPPYPASVGLFGQPTLVHNVETLANVPHIVNRGAKWYSSIGTTQSTGPKIFCISGHVRNRGIFELPLGVTLREIIEEHAQGMTFDKKLKAVIPGGASTPMLAADQLDTPMAFETLAEAGTMLGTGAIIVMNEDTCMVDAARRLMRFFAHESCGRCAPCRIGTQRMLDLLEKVEAGQGKAKDVEALEYTASSLRGLTFCPMGEAAANPVLSSLHLFRSEYDYHVKHKRCPAAA